MTAKPVLEVVPLEFVWETQDPFLFCVFHDDAYPHGNDQLGPKASLEGRRIGMDFDGIDGWRMYHGDVVPGFPSHPHRGFETVTVVRRGLVDHFDSLGATGRYGHGDVQWMTAGKGIMHSEMFPLTEQNGSNPLELFQIWLNLPRKNKMTEPHFSMFWADSIPKRTFTDDHGRKTRLEIIAGRLDDLTPPPPPPSSFASEPEAHVAIWTLAMEPRARWTLPKAPPGVERMLYHFRGGPAEVAGTRSAPSVGLRLATETEVGIDNGDLPTEMLLLQGRPIGEPVAHQGPFVMNSRAELAQAFRDYQATQFGGWPWKRNDPVHEATKGRFAKDAKGKITSPKG